MFLSPWSVAKGLREEGITLTPHPEILRPPEADSRMTFEARPLLKGKEEIAIEEGAEPLLDFPLCRNLLAQGFTHAYPCTTIRVQPAFGYSTRLNYSTRKWINTHISLLKYLGRLKLRPAFESAGEGNVIGVFKLRTEGESASKTGNLDAQW